MKKFLLGLITALILGALISVILGYIKLGFLKNQNSQGQIIDKDVKDCKDLVSNASTFGNFKMTVTSNGKPVENLEVDFSNHPGPVRCMQKTDKNGVVLFENVPAGQMFIYFNDNNFPKQFGHPPTEQVTILPKQWVEKTLELGNQ